MEQRNVEEHILKFKSFQRNLFVPYVKPTQERDQEQKSI